MEIRNILQSHIERALRELGIEPAPFVLEHPADMSHGDYACNVAMVLAKKLGENPHSLAEKIANTLQELAIDEVESVTVAGPGFINITLARNFFTQSLQNIIEVGPRYGSSDIYKGQTWLIEHTSPNPNKAMHLGHLRNNLTGMAIGNIATFVGVHTILDMVDNNRGIAIAKLMWGYLKFAHKQGKEIADVAYWFQHQSEWKNPITEGRRPDLFVDQLYVQGSEDFKNSEVEEQVRNFVVLWEDNDEYIRALWKTVLDFSYQGQDMTLARLGNRWDYKWHEHEHYQEGKDLVTEGLAKGIFTKLEDGAILTTLESYNIPDTIVQKKDGTSLYITQDLALTRLKKEKFNPDKMFWVIGPEQALAMKQVFAVSEQLGTGKYEDFIHISYGYMSLKGEGKMSSREGNVVYIDALIDQTKDALRENIADMDANLAEQVALAAIKFSILRTGRTVDMAFDLKNSISTEGDSGPYLQYTYARCQSVVQKAQEMGLISREGVTIIAPENNITPVERLLCRFPEVVLLSAQEQTPHHIANYALELSRAFNSFYAQTKLLDQENKYAAYNVMMVQAVAQVVSNSLRLLGIQAPEKM
ncbi:MAG: arginine--tRNA ligase [Candidatus Pacebacteria bacterium]|nr:arginine--tRNA ligase [Candidatus Paceibacterota bacterium]